MSANQHANQHMRDRCFCTFFKAAKRNLKLLALVLYFNYMFLIESTNQTLLYIVLKINQNPQIHYIGTSHTHTHTKTHKINNSKQYIIY